MHLRPTAISGNTTRPSFFGSSLQQSQGFHAMLGDSMTPADWYRRAKEALAKYDDLVVRVGRVADQAERKNIQEWVGSPIVEDTPAYHAQQVLTGIRDAETFIPAAVNVYQVESRTKKIENLEAINRDLDAMVTNAAASHGILPASHGVQQNKPVTESPGWVLPVVVGVSSLGIAALLTYLYQGGKA